MTTDIIVTVNFSDALCVLGVFSNMEFVATAISEHMEVTGLPRDMYKLYPIEPDVAYEEYPL